MINEKTQKEEAVIFCFKNHLKTHLTLKDGSFRNGFIQEIRAGFFMFYDIVNGLEPIFFLELRKIKPYINKTSEEKDGRRR